MNGNEPLRRQKNQLYVVGLIGKKVAADFETEHQKILDRKDSHGAR
jgi:hypothetical protein